MSDDVRASGKTTTLSVTVESKDAFDRFKKNRGLNQAEAFDELVKIMVDREFGEAHPGYAAMFDAIDELFAKVRRAAEGIVVSSEEAASKAWSKADKEIAIYKDKVDDLSKRLAELSDVRDENAALAKEVDAVKSLLDQERALTAQGRSRINELESERDAVKTREAKAEAAMAAKAEAEKGRLEAEKAAEKAASDLAAATAASDKAAEKAKADLAAAKAASDKAALQAAADLKASADSAAAAAELAATELAHAKERAAKAEGRAEALERDLSRVRDERNAAMADVASLKAEVAGLERQVSLMRDLFKVESSSEDSAGLKE